MAKVSQDNKSAVAKVCLSQLRLLQDARREAEEVREPRYYNLGLAVEGAGVLFLVAVKQRRSR